MLSALGLENCGRAVDLVVGTFALARSDTGSSPIGDEQGYNCRQSEKLHTWYLQSVRHRPPP